MNKFVHENYKNIFKNFRKITRDITLTCDLTQDLCLDMIVNSHNYKVPKEGNIKGWVWRVCKYYFYNYLRQKKKEIVKIYEDVSEYLVSNHNRFDCDFLLTKYNQIEYNLTKDELSLLRFKFVANMSMKDLAFMLDLPYSNIRQKYSRLYKKIRNLMEN